MLILYFPALSPVIRNDPSSESLTDLLDGPDTETMAFRSLRGSNGLFGSFGSIVIPLGIPM